MYQFVMVYHDDKTYKIQVENEDVQSVLNALKSGEPWLSVDKKVGFFVHYSVIKVVYYHEVASKDSTVISKAELPKAPVIPEDLAKVCEDNGNHLQVEPKPHPMGDLSSIIQ